jgi:hypothetical protein
MGVVWLGIFFAYISFASECFWNERPVVVGIRGLGSFFCCQRAFLYVMCFYYIPQWGLDLKMVSIIHLSLFFLLSFSFSFTISMFMHLVISEEKIDFIWFGLGWAGLSWIDWPLDARHLFRVDSCLSFFVDVLQELVFTTSASSWC